MFFWGPPHFIDIWRLAVGLLQAHKEANDRIKICWWLSEGVTPGTTGGNPRFLHIFTGGQEGPYSHIFVYISHWLLPEKQLLGKNVLDPIFDMGLISKKNPPTNNQPCHESGVGRLHSCKHGGFSGYMLLWGAVCFIIKPVKILGSSSLVFPWAKAGNLKWASFFWFIIVIDVKNINLFYPNHGGGMFTSPNSFWGRPSSPEAMTICRSTTCTWGCPIRRAPLQEFMSCWNGKWIPLNNERTHRFHRCCWTHGFADWCFLGLGSQILGVCVEGWHFWNHRRAYLSLVRITSQRPRYQGGSSEIRWDQLWWR